MSVKQVPERDQVRTYRNSRSERPLPVSQECCSDAEQHADAKADHYEYEQIVGDWASFARAPYGRPEEQIVRQVAEEADAADCVRSFRTAHSLCPFV
jgi:hypothetical protein